MTIIPDWIILFIINKKDIENMKIHDTKRKGLDVRTDKEHHILNLKRWFIHFITCVLNVILFHQQSFIFNYLILDISSTNENDINHRNERVLLSLP